MANNHFRMGGNTSGDVESMFTNNEVSIDLTRGPAKKVETPKTLSDLDTGVATTPKKVATPVNAKMSQNVESFDPTTIIPKKEKVDQGANELFAALDMAVEREKKEISERHEALEEAMYEDYINRESEDESVADPTSEYNVTTASSTDPDLYDEDESEDETVYDEPETYHTEEKTEDAKTSKAKVEEKVEETENTISIKKTVEDDFDYDDSEVDSDLAVDEEVNKKKTQEEEEAEFNSLIDGLKEAAKKSMTPSINKIDLSKFSIGKKPVKASTVILKDKEESMAADWVMYESCHPISMTGLTGPELIKLDPENSNRNRRNTLRDIYKIIYDHVEDSKKPGFDAWLKQTRYTDLDHIYFALYMATFSQSNFVSYQCPDCKKVFINDVKFDDMVVYKDELVKKKIDEIMSQDTNVGVVDYDVNLVQVSDRYVFGMKTPSLYNVVMETAGLPDSIVEKYADLIDTIIYIDSVYTIDYTNMELTPVLIPTVKDDPVKSTIKRIKTMYDILKKLSSDEYHGIRGYITKVSDKSSDITYKIPGAKCPYCDGEVEENKDVSASELLFTRHHLGAFASM